MSICFPLSLAGKGGVATTLTDGLIDWWEDADLVGKHASNSLPATPGPTITGAHGLNAWDISGSTNCNGILNSLLSFAFPGSGAGASHTIFFYTRRQDDGSYRLVGANPGGGNHFLASQYSQRVDYKTYSSGNPISSAWLNGEWNMVGYTFDADTDTTKPYLNAFSWETKVGGPVITQGGSWTELMAKAGLDVDTFAIWNRALTPDEILVMRGGAGGADFLTYSQL